MSARYEILKAALLAQLEARLGGAYIAYLAYEPLAVQDTPICCVLFDRVDYTTSNQQMERAYRYLVRAIYQWTDVEQAEIALDPHVDALAEAVYADVTLGGAVARGRAAVQGVAGGYLTWQRDGPTYRVLDMTVTVLDKVPWDFRLGRPA